MHKLCYNFENHSYSGQMSHSDYHWHATNECFNCFNCTKPLLGQPFLPRKGAVYCSIDCSRAHTMDDTNETETSDSFSSNKGNNLAYQRCDGNTNSIEWNSDKSLLDLSKFDSMSIR